VVKFGSLPLVAHSLENILEQRWAKYSPQGSYTYIDMFFLCTYTVHILSLVKVILSIRLDLLIFISQDYNNIIINSYFKM